MLQPKRTKFRKQHKGRNRGMASRGNKVPYEQNVARLTPRLTFAYNHR